MKSFTKPKKERLNLLNIKVYILYINIIIA